MFCYALSPSDGSEWRQRISAEAEHFIDVSAMASDAIARLINDSQIQILVNLNGYTKVCALSELLNRELLGGVRDVLSIQHACALNDTQRSACFHGSKSGTRINVLIVVLGYGSCGVSYHSS